MDTQLKQQLIRIGSAGSQPTGSLKRRPAPINTTNSMIDVTPLVGAAANDDLLAAEELSSRSAAARRVFMTKKRAADSTASSSVFKGGDLNKYTAKSYTIQNGVEIFGGRLDFCKSYTFAVNPLGVKA